MPNADELLVVDDLQKTYRVTARGSKGTTGQLKALDNVSLTVARHEVVGVVGESGSGKSTLASCLVRLEEPDSGRIEFAGTDLLQVGRRELAGFRRRMQLIYQDPYSSLNPRMDVGRAIVEPALVHGVVKRTDGEAFIASSLQMVGMSPSLADRRPHELSGGQRQRVAIARAMAAKPEMLIADEAVSALDVSVQAQILNLFAKLRTERGVAIVFISHDLSVVAHLADHVRVMYLGSIVEEGPTGSVFAHPGHPYTRSLLQAQPGRARRSESARPALRGEIPSALNLPSGCRFRTRCPVARDICREVEPVMKDLGSSRAAACHFAEEVAEGVVHWA